LTIVLGGRAVKQRVETLAEAQRPSYLSRGTRVIDSPTGKHWQKWDADDGVGPDRADPQRAGNDEFDGGTAIRRSPKHCG